MTHRRTTRIQLITLLFLLLFAGNALAQFCAPPSPPPPPPPPPPDFPTGCGGPGGGGGSGGGGGGNGGGGGGSAAGKPTPGGTATGTAPSGTSGTPSTPPSSPCPPNNCNGSPCAVSTGGYSTAAVDLEVGTNGFPLMVSREYLSSRPIDGLLGIGWTANLSSRLYYATYLYAAPDTYRKEAYIVLPSGLRLRFVENTDGSFTPPVSRYDVLVKNADGSFDLNLADASTYFHFGSSGRLETLRDEFGNALTFTYDANDRLQRASDSSGTGRYLDVYYGADGRISAVSDHTGRRVEYGYNSQGALTSVTDAADRVVAYAYTNVRFGPALSRITDPWNRIITDVTYDSLGRTKTYTEQGETYTYTYNYNGRADQSAKVDSAGNRWIYTYSSTGVVTDRTYPGSIAQQIVYNADGSLQQVTDQSGVKTQFTYGVFGRVESVTKDALGASAVRWVYTYDSAFPRKMTSMRPVVPSTGAHNPNWEGARYEYYQAGSAAPGALWKVYRMHSDGVGEDLVISYEYNTRGQTTRFTDASGAVTDFVYDAMGNLSTVTTPANNGSGIRPVTQYTVDNLGRMAGVTDPLGRTTSYTFDPVDRVKTITLVNPDPSSTLVYKITASYDETDAANPNFLINRTTDMAGKVTSDAYDQFGRLMKSTDALGNASTYSYTRGMLQSITDANGNVTSYTWDALQRPTATTFADGARETYTYRGDGMLASKTDRKLQTTTFTYDGHKRVTKKTYPNGASVTYTYVGQKLTQVVDTSVTPSETHTFTHDNRFRIASEQQSTRGTISYTYDAGDRVTSYAVAGGPTTSYGYYADGSLQTIDWTLVSGAFSYSYFLDGQDKDITFPNGQTRIFAYDALGRLASLANLHPTAGDLGSYAYGYDVDHATGATTLLGQRTSMSTGGALTRYYYDAAYHLTRVDYPGGQVHSWTYDGLGNRLTATINGTVTSLFYQKNGSNPQNSFRVSNDGANTYTYDANGNPTLFGTYTLGWDIENRMISISGGAVASYSYDYDGRRSTTAAMSTKTLLYDGDDIVRESGSTTADYLFGPGVDEPLAMYRGGTVYYYAVDGLGSVTSVRDAAGTLQNSYTYDAWGVPTNTVEAVAQPFRYAGREVGDVPAQWFNRARYYQSSTGRFLNEDPIRFIAGPNFYAYVSGNPVILTDPFGFCEWEIRERPTNDVPDLENTHHHYFYNKKTGQSIGLSTNNPIKASISPFGAPGKWEKKEDPKKNKKDKKKEDIPDSKCDCVKQKIENPGPAPQYCTVPQKLPKPGFPMCNNCQSWVSQVMKACS